MSLEAVATRALVAAGVRIGLVFNGAQVVPDVEAAWSLSDDGTRASADVVFHFDRATDFDGACLVVDGVIEDVLPIGDRARVPAGSSFTYHAFLGIAKGT